MGRYQAKFQSKANLAKTASIYPSIKPSGTYNFTTYLNESLNSYRTDVDDAKRISAEITIQRNGYLDDITNKKNSHLTAYPDTITSSGTVTFADALNAEITSLETTLTDKENDYENFKTTNAAIPGLNEYCTNLDSPPAATAVVQVENVSFWKYLWKNILVFLGVELLVLVVSYQALKETGELQDILLKSLYNVVGVGIVYSSFYFKKYYPNIEYKRRLSIYTVVVVLLVVILFFSPIIAGAIERFTQQAQKVNLNGDLSIPKSSSIFIKNITNYSIYSSVLILLLYFIYTNGFFGSKNQTPISASSGTFTPKATLTDANIIARITSFRSEIASAQRDLDLKVETRISHLNAKTILDNDLSLLTTSIANLETRFNAAIANENSLLNEIDSDVQAYFDILGSTFVRPTLDQIKKFYT